VIRHLFRLVWKRKRANALLILEIFVSFLVLFAVSRGIAATVIRWRMPLGFDYHNVWEARLSLPPRAALSEKALPERRAAVEAMLREIRTLAPVAAVAGAEMPPYSPGAWNSSIDHNGRRVTSTRDYATDDFAKVMKLPILAGRWFSADDDASPESVVVIDADLARQVFGSVQNAIGERMETGQDRMSRVVGVIAPYRKDGELADPKTNMLFERALQTAPRSFNGRAWGLDNAQDSIPREILIRVRPGTSADFEETLIKRLHAVAPDYTVRIQHMEQVRQLRNRIYLAPAIILSIVAAFLIFMVALGLSGVLWQSVTRRTREIGLRRAVGATSAIVYRQILGEVVLLATIAVTAGVLLVIQLPLISAFQALTPGSFAFGLAAALATIYSITLLCGLYPSWLAGRVQPAQALHYE
jgi:putative ABC transport system permease protein